MHLKVSKSILVVHVYDWDERLRFCLEILLLALEGLKRFFREVRRSAKWARNAWLWLWLWRCSHSISKSYSTKNLRWFCSKCWSLRWGISLASKWCGLLYLKPAGRRFWPIWVLSFFVEKIDCWAKRHMGIKSDSALRWLFAGFFW